MTDIPEEPLPENPSGSANTQLADYVGIDSLEHGRSAFTEPGFETLNGYIAGYIDDLIDQSAKVAKREKTDNISSIHVEKAAEQVAAGKIDKVYKHSGLVGGVLLGAAISNLLGMFTSGQFPPVSIAITFALAIIGAFLVALSFLHDHS